MRTTEFQDKLLKILSGEPTFSKDEQAFFDERFGPPLTESQKYDMGLRFHLHLSEDEKGEGLKKTTKENKRNTSKSLLPKSLMPLLDEATPLKKKWSLFSKFLWWCHCVRHIEVDENMWDIGEKLLAEYPNGRKAIMIDVKESIKHRTIIEY